MAKFIVRWFINTIALYAAVALVPGIVPQDPGLLSYIWLALIFGLLNALLRPLLTVLTCPLIILTLGLGTFLINMFLFYLAGVIGTNFGVGFTVSGFWHTALGALIVSIVSIVLSMVFRDELKDRRRKK